MSEYRRLLELALHLRMYGECAPGGHETWAQFDDCARERSVANPSAPTLGIDAAVGELQVAVDVAYDRFCQREHARGGHRRDDMMAALLAALPHLSPRTDAEDGEVAS